MKDLIPCLIGIIIGGVIALTVIASFFQPKFNELKRTAAHYMIAFISQRDILAFDSNNSVLSKLTILKREYCDLHNGSLEAFLESAEVYLRRFILACNDGSQLLRALEKGDGYVDKEINEAVDKMCNEKDVEEHIIKIFEKTYESLDLQYPHAIRDFVNKLKSPYFQQTNLYAHFYNRIQDLNVVSA